MYKRGKTRLNEILRATPAEDATGRRVTIFITTLIVLNVIAVVLETVEGLSTQYGSFFNAFELFSVAVFSIEYLLRLWTSNMEEKFKNPVTGRIKWISTPLALIDLFAVLPFYLPLFITFDLRFIRMLRLFRLLRILKIGRYSESLKTFGYALKSKKEDLTITIFALSVLLVIASKSDVPF